MKNANDNKTEQTGGNSKKRVLKGIIITIAVVALVAMICFLGQFIPTLKTFNSVKAVDEYPVYSVEYADNYNLDKLLENGGARSEDELVGFIVKNALHGLPVNVEYDVPSFGCTTFSAKTTDGRVFLGRNHDAYYTPVCVMRTAPKNAYKSISGVNLSYLGYSEDYLPDKFLNKLEVLAGPYFPLDGVNEKGVSIAVLQLIDEPTRQSTGKTPITTTLAIRLVLDKADSVKSALELLGQYDMYSSAGGCFQFQIADKTGRSVIVSYPHNKMTVTEADDSFQVCANFYNYDYDNKGYIVVGKKRFDIAFNKLKENGGTVSEEQAMSILKLAQSDDVTVDEVGDITPTQWSEVFDLTNAEMIISVGRNYEKSYRFTVSA